MDPMEELGPSLRRRLEADLRAHLPAGGAAAAGLPLENPICVRPEVPTDCFGWSSRDLPDYTFYSSRAGVNIHSIMV